MPVNAQISAVRWRFYPKRLNNTSSGSRGTRTHNLNVCFLDNRRKTYCSTQSPLQRRDVQILFWLASNYRWLRRLMMDHMAGRNPLETYRTWRTIIFFRLFFLFWTRKQSDAYSSITFKNSWSSELSDSLLESKPVRSQPGSHETRCHVYPEGLAHGRCCSRCALHLQVIHWSCDHSEAAQCFLWSAGQMFKSQLKTEADRTEASLHSDPQHLWYRKQRWVSIFSKVRNSFIVTTLLQGLRFKSKFWENVCTAARINPVQRYKVWFSKRMEWSIHVCTCLIPFMGSRVFFAGANPSRLRARAGCSLDKSPAHQIEW